MASKQWLRKVILSVVYALPWCFKVSSSVLFAASSTPLHLLPLPFPLTHLHVTIHLFPHALENRKKIVRKLANSIPTSPSISREYLWGGLNCLNVLYWQSGPKISCWRVGLSKQFLNASFQCFLVHSILGRPKRVPDCSSPSCITEDVTGLPLGC